MKHCRAGILKARRFSISCSTIRSKVLLANGSPGPKVSKKGMSHLSRKKLREEIDFLKTGPGFRPRAVPLRLADVTPLPKNYLHRVGLVLKISSRSFHSIKSYSTFKSGQTHRQSDRQTFKWKTL